MPFWRATYFFTGSQTPGTSTVGSDFNVGWTESWYFEDPTTSVELALARAVNPVFYVNPRRQCLASAYRIVWCRVNEAERPFRTKTAYIGALGTLGGAAQVTCALLVDIVSDVAQLPDVRVPHRRWLLRGLPSEAISGNLFNKASGAGAEIVRFLNYLARGEAPVVLAVAQSAFRMRALTNAAYSPITALTLAAPSDRRINLTAALGALVAGDRVIVSGAGLPGMRNRTWRVLVGAADPGPYLLGQNPRRMAGTWDGLGQARKVAYQYPRLNQYLIVGMRSRQTGRPFNLTRGKHSILGPG